MPEPSPAVRIESAIDYITLTTKTQKATAEMLQKANLFLLQEERFGNIVEQWSMSGFHGVKCGSLQLGERGYEGIVRLSSSTAAEHWWEFYQVAESVTRVDVQETYRMASSPTEWIVRASRRAQRWSKEHNKSLTVTLWRSNDGGCTLYLGQRSSERYSRIYNKHIESKLDHYERCIRFETEFKGESARVVCRALTDGSLVQSRIHGCLLKTIAGRGVSLPGSPESVTPISVHRTRSDIDRVLQWMTKSLRPSVRLVLESGRLDEMILALGLTSEDIEAICKRKTFILDHTDGKEN